MSDRAPDQGQAHNAAVPYDNRNRLSRVLRWLLPLLAAGILLWVVVSMITGRHHHSEHPNPQPAPQKNSDPSGEHGRGHGRDQGHPHPQAEDPTRALSASGGGYRLVLESPDRKPSARPSDLRFQILNDRDQPQLTYQLRHQRKLHLIVVRRDLTGFLHLHPTQDARGVWSVPVTIKRRGLYRVIADFQAKGPPVALGADLAVGANTQKVGPLPPPSSLARVAGYQVRLAQPKPGEALFSVTRDGRPVERLEPYLGDRGHVVALRQGDLAYAHVHPLSSQADSKRVTAHQALFRLELASGDPHRIFFQFRVKGQVHTAEFSSSSGFAPPDPDPAADDNPDAPEAEPQPEPQPEHSH